jgi:hypothetical protein
VVIPSYILDSISEIIASIVISFAPDLVRERLSFSDENGSCEPEAFVIIICLCFNLFPYFSSICIM